MRRYAGMGWALAVLVGIACQPVSAQGKKDDPTAQPATPEDYAALKGLKEISGKFAGVTGTTVTLRIDVPVPGQGTARPPSPVRPWFPARPPRTPQEAARQAAQQQQRAAQQVVRQVQQAARQANNVRTVGKLFEFPLSEGVKVRWDHPPAAFDDKGEVKKYTAAELRKLKGDHPNLPGYAATLEDLRPAQTVQFTLGKAKTANKGDKDAVENRPPVTMILIHEEGPQEDNKKGKRDKNQ